MTFSSFHNHLTDHMALCNALPALEPGIVATPGLLRETFLRGNTIPVAGKSGFATDAGHFSAEQAGLALSRPDR
jgi:phosphoheptose isomerase